MKQVFVMAIVLFALGVILGLTVPVLSVEPEAAGLSVTGSEDQIRQLVAFVPGPVDRARRACVFWGDRSTAGLLFTFIDPQTINLFFRCFYPDAILRMRSVSLRTLDRRRSRSLGSWNRPRFAE